MSISIKSITKSPKDIGIYIRAIKYRSATRNVRVPCNYGSIVLNLHINNRLWTLSNGTSERWPHPGSTTLSAYKCMAANSRAYYFAEEGRNTGCVDLKNKKNFFRRLGQWTFLRCWGGKTHSTCNTVTVVDTSGWDWKNY